MYKPDRLFQYLAAITSYLSTINGGLHYAWPSPSIPQYTSETAPFRLTNDEASWIIIMQVLSPIPSCFLGAAMMDTFGRKKCILCSALPYFVSWLMIVFANSALELYIARLIVGVSDGVTFTVVPLYIGEIADPAIRGLLGSGISVTWIFGMLVINLMGSYLSISMTAGILSLVPVIFVLTFVWMPESPYFLLMKNDEAGARAALIKLKGKNDVEDELRRLQDAIKNQNQKNGKQSILQLFKEKSNRNGIWVLIIVRNSQQLSGVAAMSFYTLTIFKEAGDFISPLAATILYVSIQCSMTAVCSILIDKAGRRPLLILSLLGSAISLFTEGSYFYVKDFTDIDTTSFNFVPVLALIGFVILFNLGAQPIPLVVQGELFPTDVKGLAGCVSEVYFCILVASVAKYFQAVRDSFGIYLPFYTFATCSFVNLIFVIFFVPETKGKTLEDIQVALRGKNKSKEIAK